MMRVPLVVDFGHMLHACVGQQGSVGIVRVSGMDAFQMAMRVFKPRGGNRIEGWEPESHRIYYGDAIDPEGDVLDEVLMMVQYS